MKEKGVITREGKGRVEGRKTLLDKHPELEELVKKYSKIKIRKGTTYKVSHNHISKLLEENHGLKIHRTSIPNILKDIELKKKEERNRRRRKS